MLTGAYNNRKSGKEYKDHIQVIEMSFSHFSDVAIFQLSYQKYIC